MIGVGFVFEFWFRGFKGGGVTVFGWEGWGRSQVSEDEEESLILDFHSVTSGYERLATDDGDGAGVCGRKARAQTAYASTMHARRYYGSLLTMRDRDAMKVVIALSGYVLLGIKFGCNREKDILHS